MPFMMSQRIGLYWESTAWKTLGGNLVQKLTFWKCFSHFCGHLSYVWTENASENKSCATWDFCKSMSSFPLSSHQTVNHLLCLKPCSIRAVASCMFNWVQIKPPPPPQEKCAQYWPTAEETEMAFRDTCFLVTVLSEDVKSYYTTRVLELQNLSVGLKMIEAVGSRPVGSSGPFSLCDLGHTHWCLCNISKFIHTVKLLIPQKLLLHELKVKVGDVLLRQRLIFWPIFSFSACDI